MNDVECETTSSQADAVEEAWWRRYLSAEACIAMLCALSVILGAVLTGSLFSRFYEEAIDDTNEGCVDSIERIFDVSHQSMDGVAKFLIQFAVVLIQQPMKQFLEEAVIVSSRLRSVAAVANNNVTDEVSAYNYILSSREDLWLDVSRLGTLYLEHSVYSSILAISIYSMHSGVNMARSASGAIMTTIVNGPTATLSAGPADQFTGVLSTPLTQYPFDVSYVPELDETRRLLPAGESVKFLNYRDIGGGQLGYPVAVRVQGSVEGIVHITVAAVQYYLRQMAVSATSQGMDSNNRIFATIASSWVAERERVLGNSNWKEHDQVGVLVGSSAKLSVTGKLKNVTNALGQTSEITVPALAMEDPDPGVRQLATYMNNNRTRYAEAARSLTVVINSTDIDNPNGPPETFYLQATRFSPGPGLDWYLHICLDHFTLYSMIDKTIAQVRTKTADDTDRINRDIRGERDVTIGVVVGVSVVVCVFATVMVHMIFASMRSVQKAMHNVAQMDLDDLDITMNSNLWEPRQMQKYFLKMVDNLIEYRAYVPSSLLNDSEVKLIEPPTGNVAIMFTDIQASTMLWKQSAEHMNEALELHNTVIREACQAHNGYEVKTIGDSFMVSFTNPMEGAAAALHIQSSLKAAKWPAELKLPEGGLVVRIGLNFGPTIAETNPITNRVDYRGSTVNCAARVEAKALGGAVCMTSDMFASIKGGISELGAPAFRSCGVHELKGLGDGFELFQVVPKSLTKRLTLSTTDCPAYVYEKTNQGLLKEMAASDRQDMLSVNSDHASSDHRRNRPRKDKILKTDLQAQRSSVTVAVCRLVCPTHHIPIPIPTTPTDRRQQPDQLRHLQSDGPCSARRYLLYRRHHQWCDW